MGKRITEREKIKKGEKYLLGEYRISTQGKLTKRPTIKEITITEDNPRYGNVYEYTNNKTGKSGYFYLWKRTVRVYPVCQESYDEFWEEFNSVAYNTIDKITSDSEQKIRSLKKYIKTV